MLGISRVSFGRSGQMTASGKRTSALRLLTFGRLAIESAEGLVAGGPRPRRLALLAILAARGARGLSRERVLAILWPDSTEDRGRHALSQTLYALRHDLGGDVVHPGAVLSLDPAQITSEIDAFHAALDARDWSRAAAIYAGPFADGFSLGDAPGFEEWLADERQRFAKEGHDAIEAAAREAESSGDFRRALPYRHRLVLAEPLSTRYALGYIQALLGLGDRAGALEHARAHTALVRRELDADPDPALAALVTELRTPVPRDPGAASRAVAPVQPSLTAVPARRRRTMAFAVALLVTVASAGTAWRLAARRSPPALPVLAVGDLRDLATQDSVRLGGVLGDMLSTNLARVSNLEIIAPTRLIQALPPDPDPTGRALNDAARQAGATEVLEGEITRLPNGFRLDLRRVDLRRGRLRRGYVVSALDRFALIDSATAAVTRDLQLQGPASSVTDVTTRSPIAYRLYEEGLRAYFQVDVYAAGRLFRAAFEEDSTFAQAAFYAWLTADADKDSIGRIALRLADRAPDRERLLMRAAMATNHSDPSALAMADSLSSRFPSDPEALIASGRARQHRFGFRRDVFADFERAFVLDSMTGPAALKGARIADALLGELDGFLLADSIAAAERTARRWIGLQPDNSTAVFQLAHLLERVGRVREADAVYGRYDEVSVIRSNIVHQGVWKGIHRGDPELLDQTCRLGLASVRDAVQYSDYRWRCLIAYRHLGRLREALTLTGTRRLAAEPGNTVGAFVGEEGLNRLLLDFEMGRPRLAARGFLEMARENASSSIWPGERARREAWGLTLAATAYAAALDTVSAAALADSIESLGARSLYGRDPALHHFVRGLVLAAANRHADALVQFLQANYSWPLGYTRVNLEYARSAVALGRPREAIYPLQAALRGGIEGPQLYVTRTELHEQLAQAFAAAGLPDSARSHYRYVARMWAGADPEFQGRRRAAAEWLARHGGA